VQTLEDRTLLAAPVAYDQPEVTVHDQPIFGMVYADDLDGDPLSYFLAASPLNGDLDFDSEGNFTFTPTALFTGSDSFTWYASDLIDDSNVATVYIDVTNEAPVAYDQSETTPAGQPLFSMVYAVDLDGDPLMFSLAFGPANGALDFDSDGNFSFTPNPGFTGSDGFTWWASDMIDDSNLGTVTINVTNSTPLAENDQAYSAADQTITVFVLNNDTDADGDLLTIVEATQPANGSVTFTDYDVTYTPNPGFASGSDSFQYTVEDPAGFSDTASVTVTMVQVTDWTLERKDETGTWVSVPDGELSWSHDELCWTPVYSPADPPFAQNIEWLADDRTDQDVNWIPFASAPGGQLAIGNPDAGEWQITPAIDFAAPDQTNFTAFMAAPKAMDDAKIVSVEWVVHQNADGTASNEAGELVDDPLVTSGKRFFPDAKNPTEEYRPKVDLLVKITPKLAGVSIWLLDHDVDDPSDHDGPIDTDPAGTVTNVNPPDNFATAGATFSISYGSGSPTDANGEMRSVVTVGSVQPGNNWRFAVAPRLPALEHVKPISTTSQGELFYDANADGFWAVGSEALLDSTSPTFKGVFVSPVLTVWRKLHVEVDSMGPVTGNVVGDTAAFVVDNGDFTSTVTLGTGGLEVDRFQEGKLWDLLANEFRIISNTANTVTVNNLANGVIPQDGSGPVTLYDDDLLQDGDDVPMPDTSELANALAEAFVLPVFDVGDNNDNVPFQRHFNTTQERINAMDWDSAGQNSTSFWVAYLLGGFEYSTGNDLDPGTQEAIAGTTFDPVGGSIIWMAVFADPDRPNAGTFTAQQEEREIVVHEIGHALADKATHDDGPTDYPIILSRYTEEYIKAIRENDKPRSP